MTSFSEKLKKIDSMEQNRKSINVNVANKYFEDCLSLYIDYEVKTILRTMENAVRKGEYTVRNGSKYISIKHRLPKRFLVYPKGNKEIIDLNPGGNSFLVMEFGKLQYKTVYDVVAPKGSKEFKLFDYSFTTKTGFLTNKRYFDISKTIEGDKMIKMILKMLSENGIESRAIINLWIEGRKYSGSGAYIRSKPCEPYSQNVDYSILPTRRESVCEGKLSGADLYIEASISF